MITPLVYALVLGAAPASPAPVIETSPTRSRAPIVAGVGASLALSGTVLWLVGNFQSGAATSPRLNTSERQADAGRIAARQQQLGGMALTLVGACAVGVSVVMWSWTPEKPGAGAATVRVAPSGRGVSLSGTFP